MNQKVIALFDTKKGLVDKEFVSKWEKSVIDVLDRFISVYDGEIDCVFWNSMVRRGYIALGASGHVTYVTHEASTHFYYSGWINTFFPYVNRMHQRRYSMCSEDNQSGDKLTPFVENDASFLLYALSDYFKPHLRGKNDSKDKDSNMKNKEKEQKNKDKEKDKEKEKGDEKEQESKKHETKIENPNKTGNPLKDRFRRSRSAALEVFPIGIATAPVTYKDLLTRKLHQLTFAAGFVGVEQNELTLEISPKIGWFIAEQLIVVKKTCLFIFNCYCFAKFCILVFSQ